MTRAIYPGSFDPVTFGHLDVIARAARLFDEVVVAAASNSNKRSLFSLEERLDMLRAVLPAGGNLRVEKIDGLLVDFVRSQQAQVVVRGLRAVSDFEFEFQMALMNRKIAAEVETIFLMPKEDFSYLSSSIVKEVSRLGGDVSAFVPEPVRLALQARFAAESAADGEGGAR